MNRCIWPGRSKATEKPWGFEIEWCGIFNGKEIHLKAGHRTSLKFHKSKSEVLYVQHGMIEAEVADERHFDDPILYPARTLKLGPGTIINVQAGCAYRLTAEDDSVVFEIGSSMDASPAIRLEDDYGRAVDKSGKYVFTHAPKQENSNDDN
tara:strand:+ start:16521 stop:16973 length:453 start_codon:yes stop_codon:yes gene_type:complete